MNSLNALAKPNLGTDLSSIGSQLVRPECVLATRSGALYTADWRGGVAQVLPDGTEKLFTGTMPDGLTARPNGIALMADGSFLHQGVCAVVVDAMTEHDLREDICRVGVSLFARGYVHATAGNISVRLPDGGYLITPTDACLGTLDPARLARVNEDGVQTGGDRASKTLTLHRRIYGADAQARCVIHTHSTHLVAASLGQGQRSDEPACDDLLPPITPYFVMKVGHVPLIPYHRPGDPAVGELVAQRIAQMQAARTPIRAVMLERLGPNVWHRSPAEASAVLEELEETARLWLLTRAAPLNPDQIDEVRQQFGARW